MRASPAFQISVRHFGIWRSFVLMLMVLAIVALTAWGLLHDPVEWTPWRVAALVSGAAPVVSATRLMRCPPMSLRWDTQAWHLGPAGLIGEEPWRGRLVVAMDFGAWMLLKFEHDVTRWPSRVSWLPVQRRGLEAQWHALRCAVYSARPAERHDAPRAAIRPESQE